MTELELGATEDEDCAGLLVVVTTDEEEAVGDDDGDDVVGVDEDVEAPPEEDGLADILMG